MHPPGNIRLPADKRQEYEAYMQERLRVAQQQAPGHVIVGQPTASAVAAGLSTTKNPLTTSLVSGVSQSLIIVM